MIQGFCRNCKRSQSDLHELALVKPHLFGQKAVVDRTFWCRHCINSENFLFIDKEGLVRVNLLTCEVMNSSFWKYSSQL